MNMIILACSLCNPFLSNNKQYNFHFYQHCKQIKLKILTFSVEPNSITNLIEEEILLYIPTNVCHQ